jgi:antibiotic biosynthesis monooxygenase (ABM) superfamily enzyme
MWKQSVIISLRYYPIWLKGNHTILITPILAEHLAYTFQELLHTYILYAI